MQRLFFLIFYFISSSLLAGTDYILCIDGGGSKTILQVLDKQGQLMTLTKHHLKSEKIETTGSNINTIGKEGVKAVLHSLFDDVQIDSVYLINLLPYCQVVAGMAGVGQNKQTVITLFEEFGLRREQILLMSDAELAIQLIDDQGIILISGTGSICFGKKNNQIYRVGGLGRILGDEGSGYQIGLQALKAALAEECGWGAMTTLTLRLREFFNVTELRSLIFKINSGEMAPSQIASCAPLVFKEASQGDKIAEEVINRAANDLANLLVTQLKISHLTDCEVHLWGGIFKNSSHEFVKKIVDLVESHENKKLRIINKSSENVAVFYAQQFILKNRR